MTISTGTAVKNPVKAAAKLSKPPTTKDLKARAEEHFSIVQKTLGLDDVQQELLPIERAMKEKIDREREKLGGRATLIESKFYARYAEFKLDPLKWRDKKGLPRLVTYDVKIPTFEFATIARRNSWETRMTFAHEVRPDLPKSMALCYADVAKLVDKEARANKMTARLTAVFEGLLPNEIRQTIRRAQGEFKQVFIVAEAPPNWSVKKENATIVKPKKVPPINNDPLVVGFDGMNYWLVAAFDLTDLESYVALTNGTTPKKK